MDISQQVDDYLRESIEYSLGLPVSKRTLELKIQSYEEEKRDGQEKCWNLKEKLAEKDKTIEGLKAESSMNAKAVKKFVEENRRLAMECDNLLSQCHKWEDECSLYDRDVQVLMDFGNEADEKAKVAESRVCYLEEELSRLTEELQVFKQKAVGQKVGTLADKESTEYLLIDTLLSTLTEKDEIASTAHSFLEANSGIDVCQEMLKVWDSLSPSTLELLALASEIKKLQNDKDLLWINLTTAEEEVTALFDENNMLDKENTKLTNLLQKERQLFDSGGKHSSESIKNYKRKSSPCPKENSPIEKKKTELSDPAGSPRQPLSPLLHNK
uniref:uncharacterized protein LOC122608533 n=1 Tax=Erigeron canadensis TaxID=72917 RepID=UPI001CB9B872|nr:uncharacterized protein LOC122608533 [Erigeron canadensis]